MKKVAKVFLYSILAIVLILAVFLGYLKFGLPKVSNVESVKIESTPELVARGKYLAHSVSACMDCHSERDWSLYSGPLVSGTLGKGGEKFSKELGFPGTFTAKNITPSALGSWTDGEIFRAITEGVSKDGRALFPVMPYLNYAKMDKNDIYAIIAYLRTIAPIENEVAESKATFPMSIILNTLPKKATFTTIPDKSNTIAYGEYLFNAASCTDCHTPQKHGQAVEGMYLAGGFKFQLQGGGTVVSSNITPDKETGIGTWTEQTFVSRFKMYADSAYTPLQVAKGTFNTYMPWTMYGTMDTSDLKAIYAYLQSVKPISNKVTKFIP